MGTGARRIHPPNPHPRYRGQTFGEETLESTTPSPTATPPDAGASRRAGHVTVRDGKAGLPYSKGLMATSIMASGLPPGRAYHVAEAIEQALHLAGRDSVSSVELRQLAAEVLEEHVGARYAENYRRWQRAQDRTVPLIVMVGGSTGVGKSTVATTVANRLGIVRIVSTDAVREVMRGIFTREMMPSIHTSSFDVATLLREPSGDADPVISGFRQQVQAVAVGVAQIIRRAVVEGTDLIVEGAHVVPGFLDLPGRRQAIVSHMVITVDEEQIHRSHFVARSHDARARGHRRYLDHFPDIRKIQRYIKALAVEHGVPVVPSYSLDATVSRVMELVVASTTDHPDEPLVLDGRPLGRPTTERTT
jgi:2-phosphoglycerate kinase